MSKHRLYEAIPVTLFQPDGPFDVALIDRAKKYHTKRINTKQEVLDFVNPWMNNEDYPVYLAQFNITKIRYPIDDPRMKDFLEGIDFIHSIADRMGIVYRVKDESGNATRIQVFNDPEIIPNLSMWPDIDTLKKFVYNTIHKKYMNRKNEWFFPETKVQNVFWWVLEDHKPTMREGEIRYLHLLEHGSSEYAFDWKWLEKNYAVY